MLSHFHPTVIFHSCSISHLCLISTPVPLSTQVPFLTLVLQNVFLAAICFALRFQTTLHPQKHEPSSFPLVSLLSFFSRPDLSGDGVQGTQRLKFHLLKIRSHHLFGLPSVKPRVGQNLGQYGFFFRVPGSSPRCGGDVTLYV